MIVTFPKEITNFIDIAIAVLRDVKHSSDLSCLIEPIRNFNEKFLQELILLKSSITSCDEILLPLDKIIAFTRKREEVINNINKSVRENNKEALMEIMGEFLYLSNNIQICHFNLTDKISKIEPVTHIGVVDDFLLLEKNLSNDFSSEKIKEKLSPLKEFKNNISGEFNFFMKLYPEYNEIQSEVNEVFSEFTSNVEKLSLLLAEDKDKEIISQEIKKFAILLKKFPSVIDKLNKIREEKISSSLPALDMLEKASLLFTEKDIEFSDLEYLFFYLLNIFQYSLDDLSNLETHSLLRKETSEKYYPFLEEKARILRERAIAFINIFKTMTGKELTFRDEPDFIPCGFGKFSFYIQFTALGTIQLHPDLYSIDIDIFPCESLSYLPLPECKRTVHKPSEIEEKTSLNSEIKKPISFNIPFSPNISKPVKKTDSMAAAVNKVPQNQIFKEVKKEPAKTWDPKGFFVSNQSTDNLINSALNRLKGGK